MLAFRISTEIVGTNALKMLKKFKTPLNNEQVQWKELILISEEDGGWDE